MIGRLGRLGSAPARRPGNRRPSAGVRGGTRGPASPYRFGFRAQIGPGRSPAMSVRIRNSIDGRAATHSPDNAARAPVTRRRLAKAWATSLMTGLNIANETTEKRSFVVQQVLALALTIGAALLAIAAFAAVAVVPAVLDFLPLSDGARTALGPGRWPVVAILVCFGLAVVYRRAPCRDASRWGWITWGAATAAILWLVGSAIGGASRRRRHRGRAPSTPPRRETGMRRGAGRSLQLDRGRRKIGHAGRRPPYSCD